MQNHMQDFGRVYQVVVVKNKGEVFTRRNILLVVIAMSLPIVFVVSFFYFGRNYPELSIFLGTNSLLLDFLQAFLFFCWPSIFAILFFDATVKIKFAAACFFILIYAPLFIAVFIFSAIYIGGIYF